MREIFSTVYASVLLHIFRGSLRSRVRCFDRRVPCFIHRIDTQDASTGGFGVYHFPLGDAVVDNLPAVQWEIMQYSCTHPVLPNVGMGVLSALCSVDMFYAYSELLTC